METPVIKVAQMAVKAQAFSQSLVNEHSTHTPATAVDTRHATTVTKLGTAITGRQRREERVSRRGSGLDVHATRLDAAAPKVAARGSELAGVRKNARRSPA